MAILLTKSCHRRMQGLTLIEVLIALAIISIAMTAIIKVISQNIRATAHLEHKTIAMYVGQQVLNEARLGLLKLEKSTGTLHEKTTMLGKDWYWEMSEVDTSNPHIKRVIVNVFMRETSDAKKAPLISMESDLYEA